MLECIADAASVEGARVDSWYSRLQNLLAHVSHGVFDDPSAIHVASGEPVVDVDLCLCDHVDEFYRTLVYGTVHNVRSTQCSHYWSHRCVHVLEPPL
jgi:hypothetical protein